MVERYLLLGLRLGKHLDGLVDSYFGPAELAARVEREPLVDAAVLVEEAAALGDIADTSWLRAQLVGLETAARLLAGEELSWLREAERCYGIRPALVPEE